MSSSSAAGDEVAREVVVDERQQQQDGVGAVRPGLGHLPRCRRRSPCARSGTSTAARTAPRSASRPPKSRSEVSTEIAAAPRLGVALRDGSPGSASLRDLALARATSA